MPNYDFACDNNSEHLIEKFVPLAEWSAEMSAWCEQCKCLAHQVVLPRGAGTTITPFVYYVNKNGEIRIPGSSNLPVPPGHTRCEVTTLHELRQLEARVGREERSKISHAREMDDAISQEETQGLRRELRSAMERMSPAGRDFAQVAIEMGNRRSSARSKSYDPQLYFNILHNSER